MRELQPPIEQSAWWEEVARDTGARVAVAQGIYAGLDHTEAGSKSARAQILNTRVQTAIQHITEGDIGCASDEIAAAFEECQTHGSAPNLLSTVRIGHEAALNARLLVALLSAAYTPRSSIEGLYHCERLAVSPIVHGRAAMYALLLAESDPNAARMFLLRYQNDDRNLMLSLMELRDPGMRGRIASS